MKALIIVIALVACLERTAAQDTWFAADKAQHFGAGAAAAGAGYAVAVPLTRRTGWRITIGTSVGIAAGGGKELRDRRRGNASWRDFAWTAGGAVTGTLVAWVIDKATD